MNPLGRRHRPRSTSARSIIRSRPALPIGYKIDHPSLYDAYQKIESRARAKGIGIMCPVVPATLENARDMIAKGVNMLILGNDMYHLQSAFKNIMADVRGSDPPELIAGHPAIRGGDFLRAASRHFCRNTKQGGSHHACNVFEGGSCGCGESRPGPRRPRRPISISSSATRNRPTSVRHKSMELFKDKLEKASNGRIAVTLFAGGSLGNEAELTDMVKMGSVQGRAAAPLAKANKKFLIYTLPFLFNDTDSVLKAMRSSFGADIAKHAEANGYYIPATGVAGGFRQISNSKKPINTPDDIAGLKIRTPPIETIVKTMQALGANPQSIPTARPTWR